jgi:hypothetical protein
VRKWQYQKGKHQKPDEINAAHPTLKWLLPLLWNVRVAMNPRWFIAYVPTAVNTKEEKLSRWKSNPTEKKSLRALFFFTLIESEHFCPALAPLLFLYLIVQFKKGTVSKGGWCAWNQEVY